MAGDFLDLNYPDGRTTSGGSLFRTGDTWGPGPVDEAAPTLTREELLQEIARAFRCATEPPPGAYCASEIAEAGGGNKSTLAEKLVEWCAAGRIVKACKINQRTYYYITPDQVREMLTGG